MGNSVRCTISKRKPVLCLSERAQVYIFRKHYRSSKWSKRVIYSCSISSTDKGTFARLSIPRYVCVSRVVHNDQGGWALRYKRKTTSVTQFFLQVIQRWLQIDRYHLIWYTDWLWRIGILILSVVISKHCFRGNTVIIVIGRHFSLIDQCRFW